MVISEFSTKTVARITGVTARQLDYWADTGFIVPSVQIGAGRGKAVSAFSGLAPDIEKPLVQFEFIRDGRDVFVGYDEERMLAITGRIGQFYWRLKVGDIVRELATKVEQPAEVENTSVQVHGRARLRDAGPDPCRAHGDARRCQRRMPRRGRRGATGEWPGMTGIHRNRKACGPEAATRPILHTYTLDPSGVGGD